jgi:CheY-like chemotaxis protein
MSQTILFIDDEKVLRDVVSDRLTREGYKVLQATDGSHGLRMALDNQPDLILLDNRMPEMGGYQMLTQLRAHDNWGANVPVIFFTNVSLTREAEADIAEVKPAHYLVKSDTSLEQLVVKIRELLGTGNS